MFESLLRLTVYIKISIDETEGVIWILYAILNGFVFGKSGGV